MPARRPNIVYILADDLGFGDVACNNPASKIPTPHLDRLAAEGLRFTDAHAASAVCTPSRYAILTGRYCWRDGLQSCVLWPFDAPLIAPDRPTVATHLRDAGYRTACIGKWHLGLTWGTTDGRPSDHGLTPGDFQGDLRTERERHIDYTQPVRGGPIDCGFDTYFGIDVPNFPPYCWFDQDRLTPLPTEPKPPEMFGRPGRMAPGWRMEAMLPELAARSVRFIEESDDQPFFLFLALTSPHTPIVPNAEFRGRSGAGVYGDFVCETDWVVGQVMQALHRRGIADDTLVIFTSDNGPESIAAAAGGCYEQARQFGHYSMGPLRGAKRDTWEGGHRVPLIARWGSTIAPGGTCDRLVCLSDLFATASELTATPLDAGVIDSTSMLPLLRDPLAPAPRESLIHHSCNGRFAVRRGDWVFIDTPSGDDLPAEPGWFKHERGYTPHTFPGELFNLRDDLPERHNRYGDRPDLVAELSALLTEVRAASPASASAGPMSE